jgi:hypothetical protein
VLLLRSEEVVDRGVVVLVRTDSPLKLRVNESVGDCVMLAGPVRGTASRRMVVKVLVVASVLSLFRDTKLKLTSGMGRCALWKASCQRCI